MNREKGVAYCGLACALCGRDCPGCKNGGDEGKDWCKSYRCCKQRELSGCWECGEASCEGGMMEKRKPRAFSNFIRIHGEEVLLDCLERNEKDGVLYHYPGGITGEYDEAESEEAIFSLLLEGRGGDRQKA